jgi:hypothetical protein
VKTARTLARHLERPAPRHMRDAVITGLEGDIEPASLAQAMKGYRQQAVPQNLPTPLDVQWKIALANGQIITITRPITDTTYVWTAPAEAGDFKISALVGSQPHGESKLTVTAALSDTTAISATATTTDTLTATSAVTTTANVCLSSAYVADVTVPDGTKFKNSEKFKKTWKVRNNGTCEWPADTALVFVSGTKLGTPDTIAVGKVAPNTEAEIGVELAAPEQYGSYTGLWQLRSGQANFGTQLSAVIVAGDPPAGNVVAGNPPPIARPVSVGSFELGGHVDSFRRPDLMRKAGMNWIKVQTFAGGDAAGITNMAHSAGFKVLLGVLGDKSRVTDPAYQAEYAQSVASMAAAGADAIEVWNEPNIDREWPNGQVSGATYTQLLAKSYNAIKAANPGTMVVSAALAPTGFFAGGCQAGGCNDDVYLQQMAAAGAANYMDCVGAHHNSGATSPAATSGHPAGGTHYSWYFAPTMNLYYGAFGGARKVCFTEFGYLTDEGYPSLSSAAPAFAWADNVTLAQQAQWLAEAAAMSINSGKVRLMIIWNVDFTNYDSDPMAGYAIIRPGDGCPACDSLGAVVGSR